MPGAASFVFLSIDVFVCLALSKDLEPLEVTTDSLLPFAEREGTENLFTILALLLSVLLGPTESFFNTRLVRQNGRRTYPF